MAEGVIKFDFDHTAAFIDGMNKGLNHLDSKMFTFRHVAQSGLQIRLYSRRKSPFSEADTILVCKEITERALSLETSFDCAWSDDELALIDALQSQGHSILSMHVVIRRGPLMVFFLEDTELLHGSVPCHELLCRMMSDYSAARALAQTLVY
ncbi:hypothetical protein HG263_04245 [Pseudoalteromonas sp. JBTF-M23]|uniref:Uncharacterized protein n=1 Tax=Pseudoalteromonas caenipelagi TaxID=2726988 RepID=A0A849V9Z7_9GAMM|nr:hypothetical protein [Pseudoalteromonas caenipelagi]NOU49745.1 hypothetical protein [Pseudoalteromonas caenipelagi]